MKEVEVRGSYKVKIRVVSQCLKYTVEKLLLFIISLVVQCSLTGEISFILLNIFLTSDLTKGPWEKKLSSFAFYERKSLTFSLLGVMVFIKK